VDTASPLFLTLDLTGTFAFALNGALTAIRVVRLDVVGVLTLGMITALGGGICRDILIDSLPPATLSDWRYLAVAASGSLVAFTFGRRLDRWMNPILVLDAAGLSLFAVSGALKALTFDVGAVQAVILGAITAVGGGTMRDVLIGRIPVVLRSELYAIPALIGALVLVTAEQLGAADLPAAVGAATLCFGIRMLGIRFDLHAPAPPKINRDA
jgi:uncharacterized membrane protein YeiH